MPALTSDSSGAWYVELGLTLGKAVLLFIGLLLASRWVLPRLFHEVAAARSPELFVTLALVIVLLTAWLTHVLGLSMALGAFLAGMLLGESHYRHQIEADIRPFRDILLGLFFVSVGMLIDLQQFATEGWLILGVTLGLMLIKGSVVALLVKLRGADNQTAWRSGLALAQGGEFCFALMAQIEQAQLLPGAQAKLLLAATFCSMALTPLLLRMAPALAARLQRAPNRELQLEAISQATAQVQGHVVICGYGRVGQSIGRFLRLEQQEFIALDDDPIRVQEAAAGEDHVHYGDSSRTDLLLAVGMLRARLLVIAVDNADIALRIVQRARSLHSHVPILVRTPRRQSASRIAGRWRQRSGARTAGIQPDAGLSRTGHARRAGATGTRPYRPGAAQPLQTAARLLPRCPQQPAGCPGPAALIDARRNSERRRLRLWTEPAGSGAGATRPRGARRPPRRYGAGPGSEHLFVCRRCGAIGRPIGGHRSG